MTAAGDTADTADKLDTFDVLVVGAGPTGMTAALLLRRLGLSCEVVDRRSGPQRAPAAHVINARSFEIWRQAGVDMDALLALAQDPAAAGAVHWVTRLGGEVLGSLAFEQQHNFDSTPTPLRNLSQHRLEPLLAREAARAGAAPRYGQKWESSIQDAGGVTSQIRDLASGSVRTLRSRYLIAADGAGSPIRKSLGIPCIGPERIQSFVMIHFAADLRALVGEHRGVLYWVADPSASGVFVAHDAASEWVFMHNWDSDSEPIDKFTPAYCETLLRRAMAGCELELAIRTISPWIMTSQTAEKYRDGRIFLAGDAAHRFPPTGGLGLNTGVQDVHNLAWKLAAVEGALAGSAGALAASAGALAGSPNPASAGSALLDSYEAERRPVACYNAEQSLANAMRMMEVPIAMGTADEPAAARRSFDAMLADGARRAEVAAVIAGQATHFDMLGLQLGYCYGGAGAAVLDDGSRAESGKDPVRDFVPSSRPGCRLPHGWVLRDGRKVSTLDLVAADAMTLFVREGSKWTAACNGNADLALPGLRVLQWEKDVEDPDHWWEHTARLGKDAALLVRPDQHVAARFAGLPAGGAAALSSALASLLATGAAESR